MSLFDPTILGAQRWTKQRESFRPIGELFNPDRHEVVPVSEADAKQFCRDHHYSGSMPPARLRVGLMRKMPFEKDLLVGLAVFTVPMQSAVLSKYLQADMETGVELGRFICLDCVEGNGESYLIAAANRMLARETKIRAVVSYCDPVARYDADGNITKRGHLGGIYQASSARLIGRSGKRTLILSRSGHVISERGLSKIKNQESGSAYAERQLIAAGAPPRQFGEEPAAYVKRVIHSDVFTRMQHAGNYVYAWGCGNALERRIVRARLAPALPYPKANDFVLAA